MTPNPDPTQRHQVDQPDPKANGESLPGPLHRWHPVVHRASVLVGRDRDHCRTSNVLPAMHSVIRCPQASHSKRPLTWSMNPIRSLHFGPGRLPFVVTVRQYGATVCLYQLLKRAFLQKCLAASVEHAVSTLKRIRPSRYKPPTHGLDAVSTIALLPQNQNGLVGAMLNRGDQIERREVSISLRNAAEGKRLSSQSATGVSE